MLNGDPLKPPPLAERVPLWPVPFGVEWLVVACICAVATWARFALQDILSTGFPFITYLPAIILTTFLFGARGGMITAFFSTLLAWFLFLPPVGSFTLHGSSMVALGLFLLTVAALIGFFSWLQRANHALVVEREVNARLAQTRELLFRELQHRVSNNLQMVAALLTVQRRRISDPGAGAALDEASRRLGTIGRISRKLYDPQGSGQQLEPFLDQLARDVIEASGRPDIAHVVDASSTAQLSPDASIPLALVVAEAISNAIEHGFEDAQDDCRLTIRLRPQGEERLAVEIEDNGRGLPSGFSLARSDSLGLNIASMLAGQLGGSFALQPGRERGAVARLELPLTA